MTLYDISIAFGYVWTEFVVWITWMQSHGITITLGQTEYTASFLSIALAVTVIYMILGFVAPFDEQENEDE